MADPVTITAITLSVSAAALAATSQIQQGNEAKRVGKAQKANADLNAKLTEDQARQDSNAVDRQGRVTVGEQTSQFAHGGVVASEGSALELIRDTNYKTGLDQARINQKARYEAAGQRASGQEAYRAGVIAQQQSRLAAAGSLIGGAAQGFGTYAGAKK